MNTGTDVHQGDHMGPRCDHATIPHAAHDRPTHDMSTMAASATLHCLTGCSIGEIAGLILSTMMGWGNVPSTALAIALSFVFGYALSSLPLLRSGMGLGQALRLVLAADTVSILTMEVVDNLVMWLVPGAMDAGLLDALFWGSMALSLVVAYFAAYPVNKALLRRGKGHAITHHASGGGPIDNRPLAYGISAFMLGGFVASLGSLL
ncbi:DUF4396 domain-containing protein [Kocuria sp.]|uniref:DUF4396 domain-containing protein n=1 Tax=Kocuria sp. TaxID=1871328 RepID=UPI0026DACD07|nr:DUF4396 domain-containing protein [Kocuria sp.]MDO4919079.1 DUF4396 domain-containing protein [Kocuria sp.]